MSFQLEKRLNTHCSTQCHYMRELHYMTNATKNQEAKLSLELEKKKLLVNKDRKSGIYIAHKD